MLDMRTVFSELEGSRPRMWCTPLALTCSGAVRARALARTRRLCLRSRVVQTALSAPMDDASDDVHFWQWRGQRIAYRAMGPAEGAPLVMVHGFALSSVHFRRLSPSFAAAGFRAYAIDLLGFGASAKPVLEYSTDLWEEVIQDFCDAFAPRQSVVLLGNSIGSLVVLKVAAGVWETRTERVRGLILLNCAGGMNSKGTLTNGSVPLLARALLLPVFAVFDAILQSPFGKVIFDRLRDRETLTNALQGLYINPERVDAELVDSILTSATDDTSFDVFVNVLTGHPGVIPRALLPQVECPVLAVWGDQDKATPLWGDVGTLLQEMHADIAEPHISLQVISSGHFPHDDSPEAVQELVTPWLNNLPARRPRRPKREEDEHLDLDDFVM